MSNLLSTEEKLLSQCDNLENLAAQHGEAVLIPIEKIDITTYRTKTIDLAKVNLLRKQISETRLLHPICVCENGNGGYRLIMGRLRLEAFIRNREYARGIPKNVDRDEILYINTEASYCQTLPLQISLDRYNYWSKIPAIILKRPTDEVESRMLFLIENLARVELHQLELSDLLCKLKVEYELKYPCTKLGFTGGGRNGNGTVTKTDFAETENPVPSFVMYISSQFRISPRKVYELLMLQHLETWRRTDFLEGKIKYTTALECARENRLMKKGVTRYGKNKSDAKNEIEASYSDELKKAIMEHKNGNIFKKNISEKPLNNESEELLREAIRSIKSLIAILSKIFFEFHLHNCKSDTSEELKLKLIELMCLSERILGGKSINALYQRTFVQRKLNIEKSELKKIKSKIKKGMPEADVKSRIATVLDRIKPEFIL